jgi:hypothetical protein
VTGKSLDEVRWAFADRQPMGRLGTPDNGIAAFNRFKILKDRLLPCLKAISPSGMAL